MASDVKYYPVGKPPLGQPASVLGPPEHIRSKRTLISTIGIYGVWVFGLGTAALLLALGMITFLWVGAMEAARNEDPPIFWRSIVRSDWTTRFVTIFSAVMRIAIATQGALCTGMIASLVLEKQGCHLGELPHFSIARNSSSGPQSLLWIMIRSARKHAYKGYLFAVLLAVILSALSQFSSTILLSDFGLTDIILTQNSSTVSWGVSNETLIYGGTGRWPTRPEVFPRFGEEFQPPPVMNDDTIQDTGAVLRVYPPFTANERSKLRSYNGAAMVVDSRVVCTQPRVEDLAFDYVRGTTGAFKVSGDLWYNLSYPMFRLNQDVPRGFSYFGNFSVIIPYTNTQIDFNVDSPWKISAGVLTNRGAVLRPSIPGSDDRFERWIVPIFVVMNVSGTATDWNVYPFDTESLNSVDSPTWTTSNSGIWTQRTNRQRRLTMDFSVCFTNTAAQEYDVELESENSLQEPQLTWDQEAREYDTSSVRRMLTGSDQGLSLADRGVLRLKEQFRWTPLRPEGQTDAWGLPWPSGEFASLSLIDSRTLALLLTPHVLAEINRANVELFLHTLRETGSLALALQSLFTIITQMSYYDLLSQADIGTPAEFTLSTTASIPLRWTGYLIIVAMLALHLALLISVTVIFLVTIEHTLLDNTWQAVSQIVSNDTLPIIEKAANMADTQVNEWLNQNGIVSVVRITDSGQRSQATFRSNRRFNDP